MGVGTGQLHCCGQQLISLNTKTAAGEEHDHVILKQVIDRIEQKLLCCPAIQYERIEAFGNVGQLMLQETRLLQLGYSREIAGDNATWTLNKV